MTPAQHPTHIVQAVCTDIGLQQRELHEVKLGATTADALKFAGDPFKRLDRGGEMNVPPNVTTGTTRITIPALGGAFGPWRIDPVVCKDTLSMVPPHTVSP
jgi:hypothetical protein